MSEIRKQMLAKKKEDILMQFQKKRQVFTEKTQKASGDDTFRSNPALSR